MSQEQHLYNLILAELERAQRSGNDRGMITPPKHLRSANQTEVYDKLKCARFHLYYSFDFEGNFYYQFRGPQDGIKDTGPSTLSEMD